tara:strand:+ start:236 stop:592 length:357 start_codon:yes stop_codon:yes gene_type:complete
MVEDEYGEAGKKFELDCLEVWRRMQKIGNFEVNIIFGHDMLFEIEMLEGGVRRKNRSIYSIRLERSSHAYAKYMEVKCIINWNKIGESIAEEKFLLMDSKWVDKAVATISKAIKDTSS